MPERRKTEVEEKEESRRSSSRCYCPVCPSLEAENREKRRSAAYHVSPPVFCSVIHSPVWGYSLWSVLSQPSPPVCLGFSYRRPPRRQVELGAGGRRDDRRRKNKKMWNGGGGERGKEVIARPAHHTHTCTLAPGRCTWGRDTPVPLGKSPLEGRREGQTGRRRGGHTCPLTNMESCELVAAQVVIV